MQSRDSVFNVPALRFPEFSGEWESKSLGEIGESLIGLTYSPSDVVKEGGTIVFRSSNIQNGVMDYGDLVRVSKKIKDAIVTREGDLLICARNGSTRLIGKNALLRKSDEGQTFGAFMMVFRSDDNRFVHQLLSTKAYSTQVSENLGARINQITTRNFAEYTFNMPPIPEEKEKLGVFLELINDRIETQSKIIEELNILRSALIDKYISDGYGQDGVQDIVTLGDNGVFIRGLSYSSSDVTDHVEMTGVIRSNNLESGHPVDTDTNVVFVRKQPSKEQQLVCGDIVICMANGSSALVGKASQYQAMKDNMTVGAFCGIYRGTHPLTKWIFMSSTYSKAVANAIQGGNGAIANLHGEDILAMRFAIPRDCGDVKRLFELFSACDAKIIDAERILAQYRLQKRFLMQKMFI